MNTLAFADAARPSRSVILRLPLLDYSIGHELLLIRQRNPLLLLNKEDFDQLESVEQRKAVIWAVLICSRRFEDSEKPHKWMRLWTWLVRKHDFALEIAEFRNYRDTGTTFPDVKPRERQQGEAEPRVLGSPHLARILNFVRFDFNFPLGLAQWLYYANAEEDGNVIVTSDGERGVMDEVERLTQEILKEQAERKKEGQ